MEARLVLFSRASGKVALAIDIGNDEVVLYFILCDEAYKRWMKSHTGLTWWPMATVPRSLDSMGTNRYCRSPENYSKR